MKEIWKSIIGFPRYKISNLGRVKSPTNNILRSRKNNKGYLTVEIRNKCTRKTAFIHRLIAQAFILNPNNYPVVNHIDENPLNNSISNLEWCTQEYNMNYGTINTRKRSGKLTKKVYQYSTDKKLICIWNSVKECRRNGYNVWDRCRHPLKFNKPYKGYLWSYYNLYDDSKDNVYTLKFYGML